jgi:uncharacterized protein (DUF486 family)
MRAILALLLLIGSNVFMTTAWYYHLKKAAWAMPIAILLSWFIALPEYCLQVPANRIGHIAFGGPFTAPQLKVLQEAITLTIFALFSVFILNERLRWNDILAFILIFLGVAVSALTPRVAGAS